MSDTTLLTRLRQKLFKDYSFAPDFVDCDFSFQCKGDSMINARIYDGDTVFIRRQSDVENGDIAAVSVDGMAVLKRVYKSPGRIELRSENPLFHSLIYEGPELDKIQILSKAVCLCGEIV